MIQHFHLGNLVRIHISSQKYYKNVTLGVCVALFALYEFNFLECFFFFIVSQQLCEEVHLLTHTRSHTYWSVAEA